MTAAGGAARYTSVAIALHWLIALLIIGNLIGGLLLDTLRASADPEVRAAARTVMSLHRALGISVIALTLARIGWRLGNPPPPLPAHMTPLERGLSHLTHIGFYVLMLAMPLTGWAMSSARVNAAPVSMFGLFDMPVLPVPVELRGLFNQSHTLLGWVTLALLALHVLAALKHQIFDRDNLLARMRP